MLSKIKEPPNIQPVYYKASGQWEPFGLLNLYTTTTFGAFILCLISHLFWGYFPDARWSSILVLIAWFWLTIIMAKYSVKVFKIRNPVMTFFITMLGVTTGWIVIWLLFWIMSLDSVGFIEFVKKNTAKPLLAQAFLHFKRGHGLISGHLLILILILGLYILIPSCVAKTQAEHPFNEQDNRWFNKKILPPIKFIGKEARKAVGLLSKGRIDEFLQFDNYQVISNLSYFFSIFALYNAKLWFYYDRKCPEIYLNVNSNKGFIDNIICNLRITKAQAGTIYKKIASKGF